MRIKNDEGLYHIYRHTLEGLDRCKMDETFDLLSLHMSILTIYFSLSAECILWTGNNRTDDS